MKINRMCVRLSIVDRFPKYTEIGLTNLETSVAQAMGVLLFLPPAEPPSQQHPSNERDYQLRSV